MGINLSFSPFFADCRKHGALGGSVLMLGSQVLHHSPEEIVGFARAHGIDALACCPDVRTYFTAMFGVEKYVDCDLNGQAEMKLDLSQPIASDLHEKFDVVIDAGTLEHVFDFAAAYRNVHDLVKPGGSIIHITPLTWFNHAFYNFNPKTFEAIAQSNNYLKVSEAYHFPDRRGFFGGTKPVLVMTFSGEEMNDERVRLYRKLFGSHATGSNVLLLVAYRKEKRTARFVPPYDIAAS